MTVSTVNSYRYYRNRHALAPCALCYSTIGLECPPLLSPALRKQGFAQNEIVTRWREVVGPLLAEEAAQLQADFWSSKA